MKNAVLIIALLTMSLTTQAQISFERTYSDSGITNAYDIIATYEGGYAVTGFKTCSSFGCLDFFLLKLDSLGNVEWVRLYDGFGADDLPRSLVQTTDSGYVMTGRTAVPGLGDNVRLIKVDKNGNELWDRNYGGAGCESGWDVEQTFDGGFIIATQADTGGTCNEIQIELIKTDASGIIEWQTQYYNTGQGRAVAVKQTADSGFVCTGVTNFMITATSGEDVFLLKTDKNGNEQWVKFYGNEGSERGEDVIIASDGGFVVVGYGGTTNALAYIIKTDLLGDTIWTQTYSHWNHTYDAGVIEDDFNNYLITGNSQLNGTSSFYLLKINSIDGAKIWEKTFKDTPNSNTAANSIALAHNGGYIMCGITSGTPPTRVYVVKTDTAGLIVGINEITPTTTTTVKVFPNPFNNYTTIDLSELMENNHSITISLIDLTGKILYETITTENFFKLYNENYPKGMYLLMLKNKHQHITTKKLIIN